MPRNAWLLALGAIALRAAAALTVVVLDSDGARDLRMAELLEQGRFAEALTVPPPTPPLHAFLSALSDLAIGNPPNAFDHGLKVIGFEKRIRSSARSIRR